MKGIQSNSVSYFPYLKQQFDQKWLHCQMLSSLSEMKNCSGYKVHEGDKREFIHRILICISPTLSNAKSIKSFLQGSVFSQLIFPICIGHELLAWLSSPYLLKRCQYFCAWFFPSWRKYAQGQRLPPVSTFPSDEKSIIFKWEASFPVVGLSPRSSHLLSFAKAASCGQGQMEECQISTYEEFFQGSCWPQGRNFRECYLSPLTFCRASKALLLE